MTRALWLVLWVLGAAGAIGFAVGRLTALYYVPILYPVLMATGVGVAVAGGVHYHRVSQVRIAVLLATVGWLGCLAMFHWVEYRVAFVAELQAWDALEGNVGGNLALSDEEARELADQVLRDEVGQGGVLGFLRYRVSSGLRLRGFAQGRLGGVWAGLVWVVEVLMGWFIVLRLGVGVARRVGLGEPPGTNR